jgi:hypothetical protein
VRGVRRGPVLAIGDRLGPGDVEQVDGFLRGFTLEKVFFAEQATVAAARGRLRVKRCGGSSKRVVHPRCG